MSTIRWIHFSDLHLNKSDVETKLLRSQLKTYLKERNIKCDYAFCSGDLRNAPDKVFPEDSVQQLKEICDVVDVPLKKFFIVPGNHDIDRDIPERKRAVRRILNNRATKHKGYYDPEKGEIKGEDLKEIKKGEANFLLIIKKLYENDHERIDAYSNLGHFLIKTENFNIVHLDSTITYNESQESNLVIGTNNLYEVLSKIDPVKYTIILSHFSFDMLVPEEKNKVCQVLQHFGVQLWMSGHLHDVLLQKHRDFLQEFQCGNFVWDGGKSTVLIGEIDSETGRGQVQCFMWQKGDGWIRNEYLNKTAPKNKAIYKFELKRNDHMLIINQLESQIVPKNNILVEKNIERIYSLYDDRYHMVKQRKYGLFTYEIIAKAILPCQKDTIFITKVLEKEEYSIKLMKKWILEMSDYLGNYERSLSKNAIVDLQVVLSRRSYEERKNLYVRDFKDILDKEFGNVPFQLSFVQIEDLDDKKNSLPQNEGIFIDSVTILFKEKELENRVNDMTVGKVFSLCPYIVEDYHSTRVINGEIENYYEQVWSEWKERMAEHEKWVFSEEQMARKIRLTDVSELTMTDGLTYEILYNQNGLLSIRFDRYLYLGGVHGTPLRKCIVYDLNTAKKLSLHEIVNFTYSEILEKIKDRLIFEYSTEKEYAGDLYKRIKEKYKSVDTFKYYISEYSSLYIYFDIYEIGGYSMGYMDLYITSLDDLANRKNGVVMETIIREMPVGSAFSKKATERRIH